jgi:hypothetical protein
VRDHEQIQRDQRRRAPPAGLRFANAGSTVAGQIDTRIFSPGNRSRCFQFPADTTTFHRVGEFTAKPVPRQTTSLEGNQFREPSSATYHDMWLNSWLLF